ncbi:NAD(P)-binding protein [Coniochaeta ligniaria NRRL 30616]|uniref:NAD(P)-binding protein n=1 Tax=Coniochaeta ligniaria NRRL 30616 TaxID=1408157 RepID=A0A1J7IZA9_9PEZI|nr:NAD(P)-binding protein [Coniochaeta ligniaria NRRL 30616]
MSLAAKTIVATGVSSGLGFEAIKQLLAQSQAYKVILGARDTARTQKAYDEVAYDRAKHSLAILPLELSDLKTVKSFAQQALEKLGQDKIDYLLLNAGATQNKEEPGQRQAKWCETYVINHLSQHYLTHLLKDKLVASKARIVVVSSGAIRGAKPEALDKDLRAGSGADPFTLYGETKFVQLLGAHWWRRQLAGSCTVIAVSPGLIPGTGLGRGSGTVLTNDMPDAKPLSEGASNILRALTVNDFPDDPDQIFLTSWGEWWSKDVIAHSLDKDLQDKWSPSKEEIESEEGLAA